MSKVKWDQSGEKLYETGVRNGVLYQQRKDGKYPLGVGWNGLTSVSENPTGGEPEAIYADNIKYLNLSSNEDLEGSIEAYMYPDEWAECDGSAELENGMFIGQQTRKTFGLCYRTEVGNDTEGVNYGYKIHLIYGGLASPSEKTFQTINDSPEANSFSWDYSTTPVTFSVTKDGVAKTYSTAIVTIDTTKLTSAAQKTALGYLEDALYGVDATTGDNAVSDADPFLPLPDEIYALFSAENPTPLTPPADLT